MSRVHVWNPLETVNPAFYPIWVSECENIIAKGGRSSTKSSVISQKLVEKKMKHPMSNQVILRKVGNTLRKSVYSQIQWALNIAGVADQFKFQVNPLQILHKKWGTGFHFSGADDPEKLKSLKIPAGYVSDLWLEEADSFDSPEEIDKIQDTFIREKLEDGQNVVTWLSYNPPKNQYHWINEYVKQKENDDDFLIHSSTYLDDTLGFNSQQIIKKIEKYKENDINYYRWMYLGEVIGMGDNVYNMDGFKRLDALNGNLIGVYFGIDTGHQISATSVVAVGLTVKREVILLDTYYYSPAGESDKKAPSDLANDIYKFIERIGKQYKVPIMQRTIDSAEGGIRNQYYKDYGIQLHPVAKKKKVDMIDNVQDLMAQGRLYYLDNEANKIVIDEHKQYRWDEKTLKSAKPDVIKEFDHSVDALQYVIQDNLVDFKLKY